VRRDVIGKLQEHLDPFSLRSVRVVCYFLAIHLTASGVRKKGIAEVSDRTYKRTFIPGLVL
jgi:hypothetical protein